MTLTQLIYFLEVVRTGSLTAAAEALQVSQPTISEQIRRLERSLGVELFIRMGRGARLTAAGDVFMPEATRVLEAVKGAKSSISNLTELEIGTLSIGLFGEASWYGLADVMIDFHSKYPGVVQYVHGQNSADVADRVREGRLEAGLVFLPVEPTGLTVRPFFSDPILYVSADPSRTASPKTIEEFCDAPLVLYDAAWSLTDPTRRALNEAAQRRGLSIRPVVDTEDFRVALELTRRGVGDTIASRRMFENVEFEGLHSVEFAEPISQELAVVHRVSTQLGPAARQFFEMFVRHVVKGDRAARDKTVTKI
jgi:DNA-binding transcriptional LysR family regulator